ncbi:glycosyltransferase [Blastococcus brunescens]|uniref:Glycosyltransferase n=1 Tax=Blastococcus brunescens TaxID=1564165 RepID=A0ABZ1B1X9_9ACTN|nr:glycosyltransferase [Blastococcus sp. BMG 8361]WRL64367.1 glycosyltransferase [Blastococcus sp. BMG 8361]
MDRLTYAGFPSARRTAPAGGTGEPPERLRILHVSEAYGGGVETLVRQFTSQQAARGHAVHLLAPPGMADVPGVARSTWTPRRSRPTSVGPALVALGRAVREHRPDVVHLHSFVAGFLGRLPGRALVSMDVPLLYQPHAWSFEVFGRRSAAVALRTWERWAARRTDLLLTNCSDEVQEGRRAGVDTSARVLGVGVDLAAFTPVPESHRVRARHDLGLSSPHVVLCMGRLAHQKGQDLLVTAWERQRPPDTVLVLLGPGDPEPLRDLAPTQWGARCWPSAARTTCARGCGPATSCSCRRGTRRSACASPRPWPAGCPWSPRPSTASGRRSGRARERRPERSCRSVT